MFGCLLRPPQWRAILLARWWTWTVPARRVTGVCPLRSVMNERETSVKRSRVLMSATTLVGCCLVGASLTGFAVVDDAPGDMSVVDDDLEGMTLVAGGEVYNAD